MEDLHSWLYLVSFVSSGVICAAIGYLVGYTRGRYDRVNEDVRKDR